MQPQDSNIRKKHLPYKIGDKNDTKKHVSKLGSWGMDCMQW